MSESAAEERRPARRQEIVDAARAIAVEEGWSAVSVRRVAARVGCSAAALYQYLPDKDAILAAIAADGGDRLAAAMEQAAADAGGPVKRLRAACRAYFDFALDKPALFRIVHGLGGVPRPSGDTASASGAVAEFLQGLAQGAIDKRHLDRSAADLAATVQALLLGFAASALDGGLGDRERASALLATSVDDLLRGAARG